jgi:cytoskeletal protein CcmA (bactofilin family)
MTTSVGTLSHFGDENSKLCLFSINFCGNMSSGAGITQLVECKLPKLDVAGSSPVARSIKRKGRDMKFFDKKENATSGNNPVPSNPGTPVPQPPIAQQQTQPLQPPQPPKQAPAPQPVPPPQAPVVAQPPAPVQTSTSIQTVLGSGLIIRGDVQSEDSINIEGVVEGTIVSGRDVVVGAQGRLRASVRAANVKISGRVVGDVTATNKVELSPGGQLQGNIRSPKLSIAESALFKGNIDMSAPDSSARDEKKTFQPVPETVKK